MTARPRPILAGFVAAFGVAAMVGAVFVIATLPPRSASLPAAPPNVIFGGYHIHTSRSDGSGSVDDVAVAAARAGLRFVILTDHGDATRPPLAPQYLHGVLCIDAVEINTAAGHLVALGLSKPSPYPLAGEAAGVVEDVHRQGGWGIVAHPDSPRDSLAWHDWSVPYDGVEWLNADAQWRDASTPALITTMARAVIRAPESIASLFKRPAVTLARWDAALEERPIVGLAGLDAHARLLGWRETGASTPTSHVLIAKPSYEDLFRTIAQAVTLDAPLGGNAAADAARVLGAIESGRTFSIVRAMAWPASIEFMATTSSGVTGMGGVAPAGSAATFSARVPEAPGVPLILFCDGRVTATGRGRVTYVSNGQPTVCRVEAYYPGRSMPWIVSNPITVRTPQPAAPAAETAPVSVMNLLDASRWRVEHDPASTGSMVAVASGLTFTVALGPGVPAGQFAAMAATLDGSAAYDRVSITASADAPIRLWAQVRLPGGKDGLRWERSLYLDATPRTITLPLESFAPVDRPSTSRPVAARITSVLLVVDTVNSLPGRRATISLSRIQLGNGSPR